MTENRLRRIEKAFIYLPLVLLILSSLLLIPQTYNPIKYLFPLLSVTVMLATALYLILAIYSCYLAIKSQLYRFAILPLIFLAGVTMTVVMSFLDREVLVNHLWGQVVLLSYALILVLYVLAAVIRWYKK